MLPARVYATLRALDFLGYDSATAAWAAILATPDWASVWDTGCSHTYPDGRTVQCILASADDIAVINSYRTLHLSF